MPPATGNVIDPKRFALGTAAGSWRHLGLSVVLYAFVLAWEISMGASGGVLIGVAGIGVFLVGYNVVRIRAANHALRSDEAARAFVLRQRRSHLLRGTATLVIVPVALVAVWITGIQAHAAATSLFWVGVVFVTVLLTWGWARWFRALPRIRSWSIDAP